MQIPNYFMKESPSLLKIQNIVLHFCYLHRNKIFILQDFFPLVSESGEDCSCEFMPKNFRESAAQILIFSFKCRAVRMLTSAEV